MLIKSEVWETSDGTFVWTALFLCGDRASKAVGRGRDQEHAYEQIREAAGEFAGEPVEHEVRIVREHRG